MFLFHIHLVYLTVCETSDDLTRFGLEQLGLDLVFAIFLLYVKLFCGAGRDPAVKWSEGKNTESAFKTK